MQSDLPAIIIGGPPHSGKSTLLYHLRQYLWQEQRAHYALRASPDGEGNWLLEADQEVAAELRQRAKGEWSPDLARWHSQDIRQRQVPLLVDVGGRITPETEVIARACSHGIVLAADPAMLAPWCASFAACGVTIVAVLHSQLAGTQHITQTDPLHGTITGLAPDASPAGICFAALCEVIATHLTTSRHDLFALHRSRTTATQVVNVADGPAGAADLWRPTDVPPLLAGIDPGQSLAIYGSGPVWLYAALAAHVLSTPQIFDVRQGWRAVPTPEYTDQPDDPAAPLAWQSTTDDARIHLHCTIKATYLPWQPRLAVPHLPDDRGIVLDGRLPLWLFAALTRAYRAAPWVALHAPQLSGAVVVASRTPAIAVGSVLPMEKFHASTRISANE